MDIPSISIDHIVSVSGPLPPDCTVDTNNFPSDLHSDSVIVLHTLLPKVVCVTVHAVIRIIDTISFL